MLPAFAQLEAVVNLEWRTMAFVIAAEPPRYRFRLGTATIPCAGDLVEQGSRPVLIPALKNGRGPATSLRPGTVTSFWFQVTGTTES